MLEVFLTVSLAYLLKRAGLFSEEHSKVLVNYVLYFALPILSFKTAHGLGFSLGVLGVALGAWLVIILSLLTAYLVGTFLRLNPSDLKTLTLISAFGNTAFLGYPYSFNYFGEEGLMYAVIYDSIGSFLAVSSIGFLILSGRFDLKPLLSFPPFLGLVLGFLLRGYQLPEAFWKFVDFSLASLLPVVLFSLGLSLEFSRMLKEGKLLLVALTLKMFISPLFALFLLKLLPINALAYKVSVVESAMPTMVTVSVLVLKFGLNHNLAFGSAGLGIVVSFFSVPLWLYLLERLPM
ncbi:MAG: AEC family transporter [Aquificaceae bacterium]|nr:AEC family transporter [Aquificaceae bacterium]MDW8294421.1 AEC family transporter [Aquificaceae bacterium]